MWLIDAIMRTALFEPNAENTDWQTSDLQIIKLVFKQ